MTSRDELLNRLTWALRHRLKELSDEEQRIRRQVRIQADEAERIEKEREQRSHWGCLAYVVILAVTVLVKWLIEWRIGRPIWTPVAYLVAMVVIVLVRWLIGKLL